MHDFCSYNPAIFVTLQDMKTLLTLLLALAMGATFEFDKTVHDFGEISLKDGEVWLHNLSQANITHVNGQRMEGTCRLQSGSTLKMGRLLMRVEYQP